MEPVKNPFVCPFNAYHKLIDARKLAFHIGRCGDRKGKDVYRCQYNQGHIFICEKKLIDHEELYQYRHILICIDVSSEWLRRKKENPSSRRMSTNLISNRD